jgi:uncharacterized membrane protein
VADAVTIAADGTFTFSRRYITGTITGMGWFVNWTLAEGTYETYVRYSVCGEIHNTGTGGPSGKLAVVRRSGSFEEVRTMARMQDSIDISAPAGKVARYIWDPNNLPNYLPVTRVEVLARESDRVEIRHDFEAGGRTTEVLCVMKMLELNRKIAFEAVEGMKLTGTWVLQGLTEYTNLNYIVDYEPPGGLLGKALDAVKMKRDMRGICSGALRKLKVLLEEEN